MKEDKKNIHVGNIIAKHIDKKRASRAELGRVLGKGSNTVNYYLKRESLPLYIVLSVSHALKHNFLSDIAAMLPEGYTTSAPPDTSKDEQIARLEDEIILLRTERQLLQETIADIITKIGAK